MFPSQGEPEPPADRIKRLQAEARAVAREHIDLLAQSLAEAAKLAAEIAEGGDLYPVGARELSRRLTDECSRQAQSLTAIIERG